MLTDTISSGASVTIWYNLSTKPDGGPFTLSFKASDEEGGDELFELDGDFIVLFDEEDASIVFPSDPSLQRRKYLFLSETFPSAL